MHRLTKGHYVELAFWLVLVAVFFAYSFEFNSEIEIYKYGATLWPRTILLLMAIAAIGQFLDQKKNGDTVSSNTMAAAHEDSAQDSTHNSLGWYINTFILLSLPFIYMTGTKWLISALAIPEDGEAKFKIITAAVIFIAYLAIGWRNHVGAILALPIFFAALMQDMGFYALAPVFIVGVMILMGERRVSRMALVMPLIYGILIAFFVSLLYVGLPTGYINPFYDFGTWMVNTFQDPFK